MRINLENWKLHSALCSRYTVSVLVPFPGLVSSVLCWFCSFIWDWLPLIVSPGVSYHLVTQSIYTLVFPRVPLSGVECMWMHMLLFAVVVISWLVVLGLFWFTKCCNVILISVGYLWEKNKKKFIDKLSLLESHSSASCSDRCQYLFLMDKWYSAITSLTSVYTELTNGCWEVYMMLR